MFHFFKKIKKNACRYHYQNLDDLIYSSCDIEQNMKLKMLGNFLPFCPTKNPKNQNFEKMKKLLGDIIILHMCTINDNHMMYGQNFLSFWTIFCTFIPSPNNPKNQNFEKMRKLPGDIITLHMCTINDNYMCGSWDMEHDGQNLSFWTVFCPFTPLTTQKIKILKKWKKNLEILPFYKCVP